MRPGPAITAVILGLLAADVALAQRPGTVVQLPTFSSFSVATTVSVPDSGSGYLGGVSRAASGSSEFGTPLLPFRNSAIGSQTSISSARATATIHDFDGMDAAILNQPGTAQTALPRSQTPLAIAGREIRAAAAGRSPAWDVTLAMAGNDPPAVTSEQIRRERQQREDSQQAEAERLFQRGISAEQAGKPGVAKIYYQMVVRRAGSGLKEQAMARIASLGGRPAAPKLAQGS